MPDRRIRAITPADVPTVVDLVHQLADYERLPEMCHLTIDQLTAALFGPAPALFGLAALDRPDAGGEGSSAGDLPTTRRDLDPVPVVVGFALYFLNFSTWEGVHGIYLEDLYVRQDRRGSGLGKALLTELARIANERGYARVEWAVLDWNAPSIAFYESLGAVPMTGWSVYRLTGQALRTAAESG